MTNKIKQFIERLNRFLLQQDIKANSFDPSKEAQVKFDDFGGVLIGTANKKIRYIVWLLLIGTVVILIADMLVD